MRRRDFITLLGGTTLLLRAVHAQEPTKRVVGFFNSGSAVAFADLFSAFRGGLKERGFEENKNIVIENRWADGQYDLLPELIADLIKRNVSVIMAGGPPAALAAKKATSKIPIVFVTGEDPVRAGLVSSINRPGRNVTGVQIFLTELEAKKLGMLREVVPNVRLIAALVNSNFVSAKAQTTELQTAAHEAGQQIRIFSASSLSELEAAFASMAQLQVGALLVAADPFFTSNSEKIVPLAAKYAIPTVYGQRAFPLAGGLMSYGTNLADGYRQAGVYAARILKGEKPAELPVLRSSKFEFVLNLKTAKALGLKVSANVLSVADEVIE